MENFEIYFRKKISVRDQLSFVLIVKHAQNTSQITGLFQIVIDLGPISFFRSETCKKNRKIYPHNI
jgi:hypothetical protein